MQITYVDPSASGYASVGVYRAGALTPGLLGVGLGAYGAIPWDAEDAAIAKAGIAHSNTTSPEQIVVEAPARLLVQAQATVAGATLALAVVTGLGIRIKVNGVVWIAGGQNGLALAAGESAAPCGGVRSFAAGDVITVEAAIFGLLSSYGTGSSKTFLHAAQVNGA